jgi:DNA-binding IclR family transcriptional regulator
VRFQTVTADHLLQRVRGEFLEMPGLRLTPAQAARFMSLDRSMCAELLEALVQSGFLARTPDGAYLRADLGA